MYHPAGYAAARLGAQAASAPEPEQYIILNCIDSTQNREYVHSVLILY